MGAQEVGWTKEECNCRTMAATVSVHRIKAETAPHTALHLTCPSRTHLRRLTIIATVAETAVSVRAADRNA
jgi:hypothetical protein